MNLRATVFRLSLLAAVSVAANSAAQEEEVQDNVRIFMRAKLKSAQQVLEGLTLENYEAIAKSSQELSLLSNAAQWRVFQTPEYVRRSAEFRTAADALTKSAQQKSLDGATLNYVKMTMRCIECHKYVRAVRQVRLEQVPPTTRSFLADSKSPLK